jgi:ribosomal protein S12 methylthiotransferase
MYLHPRHLTDGLIDFIATEEKMCDYIDLPLQHINDRILKLMGRHTTKREVMTLIKKIRKRMPYGALRTSFIVGFPSETEKEFQELCDFVKDMQFDHLGAFMYSREEATQAYDYRNQIHPSTKKRRFDRLMNLQKDISYNLNQRAIGRTYEVLVDEVDKEKMALGRTRLQCYDIDGLVYLPHKRSGVGEVTQVTITEAYEYDLVGQ